MATFHLAPRSRNAKTGPIPVSTTSADTCPDACPLKAGGCYAVANFHLRQHWNKVTNGKRGEDYDTFLGKIAALPGGQLWRHNQAGDLPGAGDTIDITALARLVEANAGRRGFTYTHKPPVGENAPAIADANARGFTINLSANNLRHADELASLGIAPVVTVLPSDARGHRNIQTPAGRRVVVCPAIYREDVTCASCGLYQRADRPVIIGFPAHGAATAMADAVASNG
jgi:hypothetical protein